MTDHLLLQAYARDRDAKAFATLVARHLGWVHAVARRLTRDAELSDDVAQAVFVVLWTKAGSVPASRPVASWLHRVTRHAAARANRSRRRRARHERLAAAGRATAIAPSVCTDDETTVEACLARLREADRRVILLRFYQQLSHAEVAAELGIEPDAARVRVARAVDRLGHLVKRHGVTAVAVPAWLASHAASEAPAALRQLVLESQPSARVAGLSRGVQTMLRIHQLRPFAIAAMLVVSTVGVALAFRAEPERPATVARAETAITRIEGESVVLAFTSEPAVRTTLHAYSQVAGKWATMPPLSGSEPVVRIDPSHAVVSSQVATYYEGRRVAAFSGITGTWDVLDLAVDEGDPQPVLWTSRVVIEHGKRLSVFSAETGKWATLDLGPARK